jgi:hypothetical protein
MNEFELNNKLAPREVVESVSEEFIVDVFAPMPLAAAVAVDRELAGASCCVICSARIVSLAKIRAALDACPCREEGV